MEKLQLKKQSFAKALQTLNEIINEPFSLIVRDATIQRFEYSFDLCWKTLSLYLKEIHGIVCRSPKGCFREGLTVGLYSPEKAERLLLMVDDRNSTTHLYNEKLADEVYQRIKNEYYSLMRDVMETMERVKG